MQIQCDPARKATSRLVLLQQYKSSRNAVARKMRWQLLLATAAALSPPKDDRSLALWLLEPSRTIDEVRAGAETLAARPPTQPCDALALCMASWAASQKQQGDLMGTLATKLAPRLSEAVDSPRCAEVLSNTARAFAVRDQRLYRVDGV